MTAETIVRADAGRARILSVGCWMDRTVLVGAVSCCRQCRSLLPVFLTYPLGLGIWMGFTDARIGRPRVFIGLENYLFTVGRREFSGCRSSTRSSIRSLRRWRNSSLGLWLALLLNKAYSIQGVHTSRLCCCPISCRRYFRRLSSGGYTTRSSRSSHGRCTEWD